MLLIRTTDFYADRELFNNQPSIHRLSEQNIMKQKTYSFNTKFNRPIQILFVIQI